MKKIIFALMLILAVAVSGCISLPQAAFIPASNVYSYSQTFDTTKTVYCQNFGDGGTIAIENPNNYAPKVVSVSALATTPQPNGNQNYGVQYGVQETNTGEVYGSTGGFTPILSIKTIGITGGVTPNGQCILSYHVEFNDFTPAETPIEPSCTPYFQCDAWSSCISGTETRNCNDGCGNYDIESRSCDIVPEPTVGLLDSIITTVSDACSSFILWLRQLININ